MDNYCMWEHHIPDFTFADDGFGELHMTDIDTFWYNVGTQLTDLEAV